MSTQGEDKITLYRSLFRGRDDIFMSDGKRRKVWLLTPPTRLTGMNSRPIGLVAVLLKNFENKTPVALTGEIIYEHLKGRVALGVYPILPDNTSYFL